ncbi:hypothetical protein PoB_001958900 [Plakobranchus ocellatus]|uniref:Uncharacterized protein n=1 Tax=Plakobranchus ocellatus TaxID=259542 RepID=A0AAV3ZGS3_9GAST|nr:hypothetical protein PoB_001958900 [Plakobranchus ocellatus]
MKNVSSLLLSVAPSASRLLLWLVIVPALSLAACLPISHSTSSSFTVQGQQIDVFSSQTADRTDAARPCLVLSQEEQIGPQFELAGAKYCRQETIFIYFDFYNF